MESLLHFDLETFIKTVGYIGMFGIVFAESGLLIGFFLPGDSLLFTAGFLASQGFFQIGWLVIIVFIGAVLGDSVGYTFGQRVGSQIFKREDSKFFNKSNLEKARSFYEKHGPITIVLARFMPVIRTFAPILAGVGKMNYRTFLTYNVIGGGLWSILLTVGGYYLGKLIPDVDKYLLPIIVVIVIVSIAPSAIHILRERRAKKSI